MNTIRNLTVCTLAILLTAGMVGCGKPKSEKSSIQGHWTGFDLTRPAEQCSVTITGNQLEYRGARTNDWCRGTFVLNGSAQPVQMDLIVQEPPPIAGKTMLLIQDLKGDEMKVAGAEPGVPLRPGNFSPGRQSRVWSFKRD